MQDNEKIIMGEWYRGIDSSIMQSPFGHMEAQKNNLETKINK